MSQHASDCEKQACPPLNQVAFAVGDVSRLMSHCRAITQGCPWLASCSISIFDTSGMWLLRHKVQVRTGSQEVAGQPQATLGNKAPGFPSQARHRQGVQCGPVSYLPETAAVRRVSVCLDGPRDKGGQWFCWTRAPGGPSGGTRDVRCFPLRWASASPGRGVTLFSLKTWGRPVWD